MHQIPSSILSLFSLSPGVVGLFGGFFIGAQLVVPSILSGRSAPKYSATRTTEITLAPTKWDPSSIPIAFPYVATVGFAAFIFASLFCILRAKGFSFSSSPGPNERPRPESPPPSPGSNSSAQRAPRRYTWLWFILLILTLLALGILAAYLYFDPYKIPTPANVFASLFPSSCSKGMSWIERRIWDCGLVAVAFVSDLNTQIFLHSRQYCKVILLALAGHFGALIITSAFRRLRTGAMTIHWFYWVVLTSRFTTAYVIASRFRWVWVAYYFLWYADVLPGVQTIHQLILHLESFLISWARALGPDEIWMLIGPLAIHATATILWTGILLLRIISHAFRLVPRRRNRILRVFAEQCLKSMLLFHAGAFFFFLISQRQVVHIKQIRRLLWRSFCCARSRQDLRDIYWLLSQQYHHWKVGQIEDFYTLRWGLRRSFYYAGEMCLETWGTLSGPPYADLRRGYGAGAVSVDESDSGSDSTASRSDQRSGEGRHHERGALMEGHLRGCRAGSAWVVDSRLFSDHRAAGYTRSCTPCVLLAPKFFGFFEFLLIPAFLIATASIMFFLLPTLEVIFGFFMLGPLFLAPIYLTVSSSSLVVWRARAEKEIGLLPPLGPPGPCFISPGWFLDATALCEAVPQKEPSPLFSNYTISPVQPGTLHFELSFDFLTPFNAALDPRRLPSSSKCLGDPPAPLLSPPTAPALVTTLTVTKTVLVTVTQITSESTPKPPLPAATLPATLKASEIAATPQEIINSKYLEVATIVIVVLFSMACLELTWGRKRKEQKSRDDVPSPLIQVVQVLGEPAQLAAPWANILDLGGIQTDQQWVAAPAINYAIEVPLEEQPLFPPLVETTDVPPSSAPAPATAPAFPAPPVPPSSQTATSTTSGSTSLPLATPAAPPTADSSSARAPSDQSRGFIVEDSDTEVKEDIEPAPQPPAVPPTPTLAASRIPPAARTLPSASTPLPSEDETSDTLPRVDLSGAAPSASSPPLVVPGDCGSQDGPMEGLKEVRRVLEERMEEVEERAGEQPRQQVAEVAALPGTPLVPCAPPPSPAQSVNGMSFYVSSRVDDTSRDRRRGLAGSASSLSSLETIHSFGERDKDWEEELKDEAQLERHSLPTTPLRSTAGLLPEAPIVPSLADLRRKLAELGPVSPGRPARSPDAVLADLSISELLPVAGPSNKQQVDAEAEAADTTVEMLDADKQRRLEEQLKHYGRKDRLHSEIKIATNFVTNQVQLVRSTVQAIPPAVVDAAGPAGSRGGQATGSRERLREWQAARRASAGPDAERDRQVIVAARLQRLRSRVAAPAAEWERERVREREQFIANNLRDHGHPDGPLAGERSAARHVAGQRVATLQRTPMAPRRTPMEGVGQRPQEGAEAREVVDVQRGENIPVLMKAEGKHRVSSVPSLK
ncbi:hypothetical protein DFH07DRAFT_984836 [Mycena maculata]|uniref:Uncharacterized protein n=1 Tax=Mycena maculata TaxID=230809 RepID=A0AAD7K0U2_9AGAR|nr:hypothetical protein DFH07DRAFT_984836 [Mycena maculata]